MSSFHLEESCLIAIPQPEYLGDSVIRRENIIQIFSDIKGLRMLLSGHTLALQKLLDMQMFGSQIAYDLLNAMFEKYIIERPIVEEAILAVASEEIARELLPCLFSPSDLSAYIQITNATLFSDGTLGLIVDVSWGEMGYGVLSYGGGNIEVGSDEIVYFYKV